MNARLLGFRQLILGIDKMDRTERWFEPPAKQAVKIRHINF